MPDFGLDLQMTPFFRAMRVDGLHNLGIALLRRLTTPRGGLFYDLQYGTDLTQFLNREYNDDDNDLIFRVEQSAISEVLKDPRVYDASAVLQLGSISERGCRLVLTIVTGLGPFKLVLKAEDINSEVIRLEGIN